MTNDKWIYDMISYQIYDMILYHIISMLSYHIWHKRILCNQNYHQRFIHTWILSRAQRGKGARLQPITVSLAAYPFWIRFCPTHIGRVEGVWTSHCEGSSSVKWNIICAQCTAQPTHSATFWLLHLALTKQKLLGPHGQRSTRRACGKPFSWFQPERGLSENGEVIPLH